MESVQKLFDVAGIESVVSPGGDNAPTTLTGYFNCSSPPTLGFNVPSADNATAALLRRGSSVSLASSTFNILPNQLVQYQDGDNCTASIQGTTQFPFWLVGQGTLCFLIWVVFMTLYRRNPPFCGKRSRLTRAVVFFQGKYIDHSHDDETMGFATLLEE